MTAGVALLFGLIPVVALGQAPSRSLVLAWRVPGDSAFRVGYARRIATTADPASIAVRQAGRWLISPQSCDSTLAATGNCSMVLRLVTDSVAVGYGSLDSAVARPGLPPSEPIPVRVTSTGQWNVPYDWQTGSRDPVLAAFEFGELIPIRFPSHPVHAGEEWAVTSRFNHRTPHKQFADSFSGTARLDSLTGPAGHQLAWLSLHGTSIGWSRFMGISRDSLTIESTVVWEVEGGRPVRVSSTSSGTSALLGKGGKYSPVGVTMETEVTLEPDTAWHRPGDIP